MCDNLDLDLEQGDDNLSDNNNDFTSETSAEFDSSPIDDDPTEIDSSLIDDTPTKSDWAGGLKSVKMPSKVFTQANADVNSTFNESANDFDGTHLEHDSALNDLEKIKQDLDDELGVSDEELDNLQHRAEGIEREDHHDGISFKGIKICATRHGCTGATNCDYDMSGPVGR